MTAPAPPAPALTGPAALSCYTTSLVAALRTRLPDPQLRLAHAVRLAVRADLPDGVLAFSHHDRIDLADDESEGGGGGGGRRFGYRGAATWQTAAARLAAALAAGEGPVIAVGNTRTVPWSPSYGRTAVPHWLLVEEHRDGRWYVDDGFAALLPDGEQRPYAGWLDDGELRAALTPTGPLPPQVELRDRYALGTEVEPPPPAHYRWLSWDPPRTTPPPPLLPRGSRDTWLRGTVPVLAFLAHRLGTDERALARHADDLWAASRHHRHRLAVLAGAGLIGPQAAQAAAGSWAELPRALRFATASAQRGRPRPALVAKAFDAVIETMSRVTTEETR